MNTKKMLAIFLSLAMLAMPIVSLADAVDTAADPAAADAAAADAATADPAAEDVLYWGWIDLQSLRLYELGLDFVTPDSIAPINDDELAALNATAPAEGALTWPLVLARFSSTEVGDTATLTLTNEFYSSDAPDIDAYMNMLVFDVMTFQGDVNNMQISDPVDLVLSEQTFRNLTVNYGENMIIDVMAIAVEGSMYAFTFVGTVEEHERIMPTVTEAVLPYVEVSEEEAVG